MTRRPKREIRYPAVLRIRLTKATTEALDRTAGKVRRGVHARNLIEQALGQTLSPAPQRRALAPVHSQRELADAVRLLGSVSGNLQRMYTVLADGRGVTDCELAALKAEIRDVAAKVRGAIGETSDP